MTCKNQTVGGKGELQATNKKSKKIVYLLFWMHLKEIHKKEEINYTCFKSHPLSLVRRRQCQEWIYNNSFIGTAAAHSQKKRNPYIYTFTAANAQCTILHEKPKKSINTIIILEIS